MPVNARWFLKHLEELKLSQRKFAKHLGLDPAAVTLMLKGKRKLQSSEAADIAKLFRVTVEEVLEAAGVKCPDQKSHGVKVTGWVDEHWTVHWGKVKGPGKVSFPGIAERLEALRVQTAGTALSGLDGAVILYEGPIKEIDLEVPGDVVGRLSLVKLKGRVTNPWRVRIPRRGYEFGTYNLFGVNGEPMEEAVDLETAVLVAWLRL